MILVRTIGEVFEAIQRVKTHASSFCTNFFPAQQKLKEWVDQGKLFGEFSDEIACFFRRDRGFWHLYFCAANVVTLQQEIATLSSLKTERLVVDLVGKAPVLDDLLGVLASVGFQHYVQLQRMACVSQSSLPVPAIGDSQVAWADTVDSQAILDLLHFSFDQYADQLPEFLEIEAAVKRRQILKIERDGVLAALLFFETQGFTSTIRYWAVTKSFRSCGFGSALMRHYFATQSGIRRFTLWVATHNENAVRKYEHYGYRPDGLIDHVLTNKGTIT
jgi:GNAT superfamily N-acetyltransferase